MSASQRQIAQLIQLVCVERQTIGSRYNAEHRHLISR